jgi:hypothetical protein
MRRVKAMQAVVETKQDGTVAIALDGEAARAMIASIVFASRFHEGILPLAGMLQADLPGKEAQEAGKSPCH